MAWQLRQSLDSKLWNWEGGFLMSILGETPDAASDLQAQVGQAMLLQ